MRFSGLVFILALLPVLPAAAGVPSCMPVDDGGLRVLNDTCISAHVYDVVTLENGTRFLDVCSPDVPDAKCRFSVVSYAADKRSVGELSQLRDKDIELRGAVAHYGQRYLMVLNDERQFHRGAAQFRPDPRLLSGFSAEDGLPQNAPELRVNFHHRGRKLEHE